MNTSAHQEVVIKEDDFIVSKTDPKGKITYCNRIFIEIAGYPEAELLGQPHNIIRHPDMPRSVFRALWQTLQAGQEFFGIIKNRTRNGGYYWAFANVTPSHDEKGQLLGYYSVRRCPRRESIAQLEPVYRAMKEEEQRHDSAREAMDASWAILQQQLDQAGKSYEEFILGLEE
jgi:PAS domain S-box-containing protein